MNLSYSWLKEFISDLPPVNELGDTLIDIGLGVEGIETLPAAPEGVVVGRVDSLNPVEGSDHLLHITVNDGSKDYSVVTGAPNTKVGMLTALAKVGAVLPAGFTVAAKEMMGHASEGVVCSPKELGLYDYAAGLIEFGDDVSVGDSLASLWPAEEIIELEITPNRADAFSMLGVARDLSAKLGVPFKHPADGLDLGDSSDAMGLSVELQDADCKRFTLRLIEGVEVKPSPIWMQRRLAGLGLRPRNNLVDCTNYVTFELGQPSHAYDSNDLVDGKIIVRSAVDGETIVALDDNTYEVTSADMLITTPNADGNGTQPTGIGGVIGGAHHSINPNTTTVALEAAHFDPVRVRKTAKRHTLNTDAGFRFERGVDPNLPAIANARVSSLIAELGGGTLRGGLVDVGQEDIVRPTVDFRPSRVHFLMDLDVPLEEQEAYLTALGCGVEKVEADLWRIQPPSWRFDMAIEEDMIEEVSRMHGFEHLKETMPAMHFVPKGIDSTHRQFKSLLVGFGLTEAMNYTFSYPEELAKAFAPAATVELTHPQSVERSVLRTALYPNMLNAAKTNHAVPNLALFEVGNVFLETEETRLCIFMRGQATTSNWLSGEAIDFYDFKGLFEKLAATMGADFHLENEVHAALHPGVSASIIWNGQAIGFIGRLHPEIAAHYDLGESYIAEVSMPLASKDVSFSDYDRQPHAELDVAIVAPVEVSYASLEELIRVNAGERLADLNVFDVYSGKPIPEGMRSIAFNMRFRHPERALKDDEIDGYLKAVVSGILDAGFSIRDS